MATYEITVTTQDGEYPTVSGIRRLGLYRRLAMKIREWIGRPILPGKERANIEIVNMQTIDIVMDVPDTRLRQEIADKLAGMPNSKNARLVLCLPAKRRKLTGRAVEV